MLRTVRKCEEPKMAVLPAAEDLHCCRDQLLRYPTVPVFRVDRERAKEPEAPPVRYKVRTDELSVSLGAECCGRIGPKAGVRIAGVAHEAQRVGESEERAEGEANDAFSTVEISFDERANNHLNGRLRCGHGTIQAPERTSCKRSERLILAELNLKPGDR